MRADLASVFLVALFPLGTARADDWPTYRSDPARSGVVLESPELPLREAWSFATPFPPRPAWPEAAKWDGWHKVYGLSTRMTFDRAYEVAGAGDRVYFGSSSSDQLYCLDLRTGSRAWSVFTEGPVRFAPVIEGDRVWFGSDDGLVYSVDAKSGDIVWTYRPGPRDRRAAGNERVISVWPVRGGLVLHDGVLFGAAGVFPSEGVFVFALDPTSGQEIWKTEMKDLPAQGYLLASATRLYVPSGRNNPMVFDRKSGERLRVVEGQGGSYCLLSGDSIIFGPGIQNQLGIVEGENTDQLASFAGRSLVVTNEHAFLQTDAELSAIDRPRYLDLARQKKLLRERRAKIEKALEKAGEDPDRASASAVEALRAELVRTGTALESTERAMDACLEWKTPASEGGSLILAGRVLFAAGEGRIVARDAESGARLWEAEVPGEVYSLAVLSGRLLASTDEGRIHCFEPVASPRGRKEASK